MPSDQTIPLKTKKPIENIWILGGGTFGQRAAETILRHNPSTRLTIVDLHPSSHLPNSATIIQKNVISWLYENLTPTAAVDKIIPAIPLHLAAEWLKKKIALDNFTIESVELDNSYLQGLPHPIRQGISQVSISYADFLCPPHCSEPEEICTFTQKPRPTPLYELLLTHDFNPFTRCIIRSRQFGAGVGGFFPKDLLDIYENVKSMSDASLLLATACKCHGIIDVFTLKRPQ